MVARVRALALSVVVAAGLLLTVAGPVLAAPNEVALLAQEAEDEAEEAAPVLFGTFRTPDGPVEGIELSISEVDGDQLGTVTSDASGQWEFEVPGPGDYAVTVEALPDDVELRDPDASTVEVSVASGRRAVPIPVGEGGVVSGRVALALQQTLSGIRFGLVIAMTAVGLSLIFGTTGLINFAHGEIVVIGAVVAWFANTAGLHLVLAAVLGIIAASLAAGVLDRGVFRPLTRRSVGLFQLLVVTIGLSLILRFTLLIIFGGRSQPYTQYAVQQRITLGPFATTPRDLVIIAISLLVLIGVATGLQRSRIGKAMRAVADNRDLAESSGINVERVVSVVWLTGGALAGLGGVLYGTMFRVSYDFGFQPMLLLMFAGVILGGLGTAYGAMVGSLVVGLVTELSVVYFPQELKTAWALGVLVIVLLVRPQGLLGRRERIG
ncbi:branched-chain amino acid ABC transporter permease [Nitriliruptor alkaliphilus]|uniref:branched-chain amino acid ABC transporter permease n=1 Tax=Nitriliruptor alkaliphilus TaxID=427918 RepID=UPI0006983B23|nr:branched-chain amino acid ABC transporter permease [Nitriliruptor alkaliphilus]